MKFNEMLEYMEHWRNEDQRDQLQMSRNDVIELLEGIKELEESRNELAILVGIRQ